MLAAFLVLLVLPASAGDYYPSVAALRAGQREGRDFRVVLADRHAPVTVFSIHGGDIESGTSELAAETAGGDWNLYDFEGLMGARSFERLHVTSTHFDDPPAVALATAAWVAVSFHGEGAGAGGPDICVGGGNAALRKAAAAELSSAGFAVEEPCRRLPGVNPDNIVNRAKQSGLQLELAQELRGRLKDGALRSRFVDATRRALAPFAR